MPDDLVNDSGLPLEAVMDILEKHGIEIRYGSMTMKAERRALEDACREVSKCDVAQRHRTMSTVDRALRKALPRLAAGKFTKKLCDDFHANLVLWEALKRSAS